MDDIRYEMILCIVNAGFSGDVMEAARSAGTRGGTIIEARGTANREAEKFFGISIQPEKDVVFMVVPASIKDDVLRAIYEKTGLESEGQGIAFSVPVSKAVGLSSGVKKDRDETEEKGKED